MLLANTRDSFSFSLALQNIHITYEFWLLRLTVVARKLRPHRMGCMHGRTGQATLEEQVSYATGAPVAAGKNRYLVLYTDSQRLKSILYAPTHRSTYCARSVLHIKKESTQQRHTGIRRGLSKATLWFQSSRLQYGAGSSYDAQQSLFRKE